MNKKILIRILLACSLLVYCPKIIRASSDTGIATARLEQEKTDYQVGQTFPLRIIFDSHLQQISGLDLVINYQFSGVDPEIEVVDADTDLDGIQIQTHLGYFPLDFQYIDNRVVKSGNKITMILSGTVTRDIDETGYITPGEVTFGTINFLANKPVNNLTISFDKNRSIIGERQNGTDILKTPTSTATFTISQVSPTSILTPVPTSSPTSPPLTSTPTTCPTLNIGDLNCDGKINEVDLAMFLKEQPASLTLTTLFSHWQP